MTLDELKKVMVDTLSTDEAKITEEAKLVDDLGIDSLDAVELNMAIEDAAGVSIPDEKLGQIETVADMLKIING